jgi:hypothetical protein
MRRALIPLLLISFSAAAAGDPEEKPILAVIQRLFDAMAAHDGDAVRAVSVTNGRIFASRASGVANTSFEEFAVRMSAAKQKYLERIWKPRIQVRGAVANVWADYDFHVDGKLDHCGIDSFSLVKMPEGWKIAGLAFTSETTGCAPSPLGPPRD